MKAVKIIVASIVLIALIDIAILALGLFEVSQGTQPYFNPFWKSQTGFVIDILK